LSDSQLANVVAHAQELMDELAELEVMVTRVVAS